ncbi:unnamed protein product [Peronospora destructor]|uniref:Uncharacterized protein n=1 Tax=Peronospora destructor TaxID=86335 RepID=A0AAV0VKW9_9STRA|nr:unnamed protein product [Peronospora destructor]
MADFAPGSWGPNIGVYGAVFATLALGFTEGCLEIERQPDPPAVCVALCCRQRAAQHRSRSVNIAKRLVLIKSIRALRMAAGSYGLAWSLWCWHKTDPVNSNNDKVEVMEDVESVLNGERDQKERVKVIEVELSDIETTVAYASKLKAQVSRSDISSLYSVAVLPPYGQPLPMSMMDTFDVYFNPLSAVLTFIASVCHDRGETHVFLVADQEEGESGEAGDVADRNAATTRQCLPTSLLATGLLYRHGITTSVVKTQKTEPVDEDAKGEAKMDDAVNYNFGVVFLIAKNLDAGDTIARKFIDQGIVMQENIRFIVEESLSSQSALSEESQAQSVILKKAMSTETEENKKQELTTYFSFADVSDQTLQGIRELLWQGEKPDTIQAALYRAYGTQRVVAPTRVDVFSDLDF